MWIGRKKKKKTKITSISIESSTICSVTRSVTNELSLKCVIYDLPHWAFPFRLRECLNKCCILLSTWPAQCQSDGLRERSCLRNSNAMGPFPERTFGVLRLVKHNDISQTTITQAPWCHLSWRRTLPSFPGTGLPLLQSLPMWSPF